MKINLCLLARNEYACLVQLLPKIIELSHQLGLSIVAIDPNSSDGSRLLYLQNGVEVIEQKKSGRGAAMIQAIEELECDAIIFFSPDGNEDIEDLPIMIEYLNQNYDLVIASRMMKGAWNEEDHLFFKWRKWACQVFNWLAILFFKPRRLMTVTDSINGYRAVRRLKIKELKLTANDHTIEYQMTIRAMHNQLRIVEFATKEGERLAGESGVPSIPTGFRFIKRLFFEIKYHFINN